MGRLLSSSRFRGLRAQRIATIASRLIEPLENRLLLAQFANGIDSDNLGEGVWAWGLQSSMANLGYKTGSTYNYAGYFNYVHNTQGAQYIIIKAADGGSVYQNPAGSQSYTTTVRNAAHAAGLKIFPYFYIRGTTEAVEQSEIAVFNQIVNSVGADGVVFDIEGDWDNFTTTKVVNTTERDSRIVEYFNGIGKSQNEDGTGANDSMFMAYSSFPYVSFHSEDPFLKLGDYCDAAMPQPYWAVLGTSPSGTRSPTPGQPLTGVGGPSRMVKDVDSEYRMMSLQSPPKATIFNGHPESVKPVIMTGQMYDSATPAEITEFYNAVKNDTTAVGSGNVAGYKYRSVNFFDEDTVGRTSQAQMDALNSLSIGDLPGMPATPAPANNATIAASPTILNWADVVNTFGTGSVGAATSYDVYIDGLLKANITASQYTVSTTLAAGVHTWQVKANDILGTTAGPVWNFTIGINAPTNLAATDGLFANHISLSWTAVSNATTYQVYRNSTNDSATATLQASPTLATYDDFMATPNVTYYYWVAGQNGSVISAKSTADTGFSDAIAPTVTGNSFQSQFGPLDVSFTFSEAVGASINLASLTLSNLDQSGGPVPTVTSLQYISASNTANFFLGSDLPDGNFRATINGVTDVASNALAGSNTYDFYFLRGDASGDRVVNAMDFNALATHFGSASAGFAGGDFNFDGTVNTEDFSDMATRWGTVLAAPAPSQPITMAHLASRGCELVQQCSDW